MIMFMALISNLINSYKMTLKIILSTDQQWEVAVRKLAEHGLGLAHKREKNFELSGHWGERRQEKVFCKETAGCRPTKESLIKF